MVHGAANSQTLFACLWLNNGNDTGVALTSALVMKNRTRASPLWHPGASFAATEPSPFLLRSRNSQVCGLINPDQSETFAH